jgi:hypothetical protein
MAESRDEVPHEATCLRSALSTKFRSRLVVRVDSFARDSLNVYKYSPLCRSANRAR